MNLQFKIATTEYAHTIGEMVVELTTEISIMSEAKLFDINLNETVERCEFLMKAGHYHAILAFDGTTPIGVTTLTETYALYAGGKIGVIQEFYIQPDYRSAGIGAKLIEKVKHFGEQRGWSCIELCTPPLPAFERTLAFYQANGLAPVGGRKMRGNLA